MVRYGRGTFTAHPAYIEYMNMVVQHPNFAGMPNAIGGDGRINWQVSSGKSTSFYKDYLARRDWWIAKADALGLPGTENGQERFTLAARLINPTGYRPCRLCGEARNVGYFYLSFQGVRAFHRVAPNISLRKLMPVTEALDSMTSEQRDRVAALFPDRAAAFAKWGVSGRAFEETNHLRSLLLSPGFMANPPDRLDGFHDYCSVTCRAKQDPGRSVLNMRSYTKDRRAFEYWAEGDWNLAQDLYNQAGPGQCRVCGDELERVSPDHVGPLSCGFAQIPLFEPLCGSHNSSKQRRLTADDVRRLVAYEQRTGASVMSWYSRSFWDAAKARATSKTGAVALSNVLRARQDIYLRCLEVLRQAGQYVFLRSLLMPECALNSYTFKGLNRGTFEFDSIITMPERTNQRASLARRSVRIALESLIDYSAKPSFNRKKARDLDAQVANALRDHLGVRPDLLVIPGNEAWGNVAALLSAGASADEIEAAVQDVIWEAPIDTSNFQRIRAAIVKTIDDLA
jgi:Alw26I/Eco31I/Esp3I family type II restriction endonuclease